MSCSTHRRAGARTSTAQVSTLSGTGLDSRFEMVWRQRLPDPDTLGLGRAGDDLLVTVDGFRYPVRLPSVLRRCDAIDAHWDGERLHIVFAPDPAVGRYGEPPCPPIVDRVPFHSAAAACGVACAHRSGT